jgi:exodeoxyribonuclease VII small subunit
MATTQPKSLDAAHQELQTIVSEFEQGKLNLEDSLKKYRRGLELAKFIKTKLSEVENQIIEIKEEFEKLGE